MTSWFSVSIHSTIETEQLFVGFFKIDNNTKLVTEFYETINGNTNFNNNILIPTGTGIPSVINNYKGFNGYEYYNMFYDNAYDPSWLQFDNNGIAINSMSKYPQYNKFNLWAANVGDETLNNIGIVGNYFLTNVTFTIIPTVNPKPINPCFLEGSKILCLKDNSEVYLPIESLNKGDLVKTLLNNYVPIKAIGSSVIKYDPSIELHQKDKLFLLSKDSYPELFEDLVLTGAHSILVDEITEEQRNKIIKNFGKIYETDDKYRLMACVDDKTSEYNYKSDQTIWHLALENDNKYHNYGIYANGLLVESVSIRYMLELSNMVIKD